MTRLPPQVRDEAWLAKRLQAPLLFAGLTTAEERKARLRRHLVDQHLEHAIAGKGPQGRVESFAQVFERIWGEPL